MNIQINEGQLNVIQEMISFQGLSISVEAAIYEMLNNEINGIEQTLYELKELKAKQLQRINHLNHPRLYIVK